MLKSTVNTDLVIRIFCNTENFRSPKWQALWAANAK